MAYNYRVPTGSDDNLTNANDALTFNLDIQDLVQGHSTFYMDIGSEQYIHIAYMCLT